VTGPAVSRASLFRRYGDKYAARFGAAEAMVVRRVISEIVGLIDREPARTDPDRAILDRLFPNAYPDDPHDGAEFRRLTYGDLARTKREQANVVLRTLPADGGVVALDAENAEAWLRALTDVRLALGLRLNITEDMDLQSAIDEAVAADPTSARVAQLCVYAYLTYLQESLVDSLMRQ